MTYRGPWNAAGVRHRQTPRRYKPCVPVGDYLHVNAYLSELDIRNDIGDCVSCPGCGHLLCSCQNLAYEPPVYASGGSSPKQYAKRIADEVLKQAHRASKQQQGGTAAEGPPRYQCGPDLTCQSCRNLTSYLIDSQCRACTYAPLTKVRQASERVRSVGIPALCVACAGKLPGDAHHCELGDCQCAECRAYLKEVAGDGAWERLTELKREAGSSASSSLTGKDEGSRQTDSASMTYSQPSAETGINQTQPVMFEGRPLMIGDFVRAISAPQVVCMVVDYESTRTGIYLTLSQPGTSPMSGYTASNWTRLIRPLGDVVGP